MAHSLISVMMRQLLFNFRTRIMENDRINRRKTKFRDKGGRKKTTPYLIKNVPCSKLLQECLSETGTAAD